MMKDPFLLFMEKVTQVNDRLKELYADVEEVKASRSSPPNIFMHDLLLGFLLCLLYRSRLRIKVLSSELTLLCNRLLTSLISEEGQPPLIGGRRAADAVVVSTVVLLSFVYLYLIGYIDRGGSKAGSSGSLEFRNVYISIDLFQAAYVWIKFRDVISRGAVYKRRDSNKFEPRIKFPVTRGVGCKSKRLPLGLYDTRAEGEVAYRIAAFYCKKRKYTGRLDLGGGEYFRIPAMRVDPNLSYEEKVEQVGDQVSKVYAEFEDRKASRNQPPSVPGLAFEMPNGEGHLSPTGQLRQPLNSGMDSAMQGQGSQLGSNTHNGVDFNNPSCLHLELAKTQHEFLDANKEITCLKDKLSGAHFENTHLELKNSQLQHENGLLTNQNLQLQAQLQTQHEGNEFVQSQPQTQHEGQEFGQSQPQTQHEGQEFDTDACSAWMMNSRWGGDMMW